MTKQFLGGVFLFLISWLTFKLYENIFDKMVVTVVAPAPPRHLLSSERLRIDDCARVFRQLFSVQFDDSSTCQSRKQQQPEEEEEMKKQKTWSRNGGWKWCRKERQSELSARKNQKGKRRKRRRNCCVVLMATQHAHNGWPFSSSSSFSSVVINERFVVCLCIVTVLEFCSRKIKCNFH